MLLLRKWKKIYKTYLRKSGNKYNNSIYGKTRTKWSGFIRPMKRSMNDYDFIWYPHKLTNYHYNSSPKSVSGTLTPKYWCAAKAEHSNQPYNNEWCSFTFQCRCHSWSGAAPVWFLFQLIYCLSYNSFMHLCAKWLTCVTFSTSTCKCHTSKLQFYKLQAMSCTNTLFMLRTSIKCKML